jgi:hypothetical protein
MVINNDSSASEICFFDYVQKTYADSKNCIVGSTLMGILDESYIGRFTYLINHDMNSIFEQDRDLSYSEIDWNFKENPLWIESIPPSEKHSTHTSAGLLGFSLSPNSVIPFPSGYNEDWNWCLLQSALYGTKFYIEQVPVIHAPPSIVPYEQKLLLWESLGELIFDSLHEAISSKFEFNDMEDIRNLTSKKITIKNKVRNQLKIIETLNSFKKDTVDSIEQKKINTNISQIENTIHDLKLVNLIEYVDSWFKDLIKRKLIFSKIIGNQELCSQIHKVLSCAQIKQVKLQ